MQGVVSRMPNTPEQSTRCLFYFIFIFNINTLKNDERLSNNELPQIEGKSASNIKPKSETICLLK